MSSSNLIRWCGLAELLAGVLIALFLLLHSERDVASVLGVYYTAQHFLGIGAAILGLLGLIGLYAVQLQQAGWPGLIGFLLAFTGTALRVGQAFFDGVTIPLIATYARKRRPAAAAVAAPSPRPVRIAVDREAFSAVEKALVAAASGFRRERRGRQQQDR